MVIIKGIIGDTYTYANFIAALANEKDNKIIVQIDSEGGFVDTGLMMYDELERLKASGRYIETQAVNKCMSIATIPFMAGNERIAMCDLMIHNPWKTQTGDADTFAELAKGLNQIKKKLVDIYLQKVNISQQQVYDLMKEVSYITPNEAVGMGFATAVKDGVMNKFIRSEAKAFINKNQIEKMTKNQKTVSERLKELSGRAMNLLRGVKNLMYVTKEEIELVVLRDEGLPEVGDEANPDGVHNVTVFFEDERTEEWIITVADGYITDIQKMNMPNQEEVINVLTESLALNRELEAENRRLIQNQVTPENEEILKKVRAAGGINKLLSGVKNQSSYTPPSRTGFRNTPSNNGVVDVEELKNKYISRKK